MDLHLAQIVFEVSAGAPVSLLPRLYDAVRRFESCFKSVCCPYGDLPCRLCGGLSECCPHRSVFCQTLSTDPDVVRRHQKPPLPFAFKISEIAHDTSNSELVLVIAGSAIQHLSLFHKAIRLMLDKIAVDHGFDLSVSGSWCLDYQGGRHELNAATHSLLLLSGREILQASQYTDTVRILVESPLRLLSGGSIIHSFDFGALLRSQMRRCSSFFAHYGEGELELDYVYMSEAAARVTALENGFSFTTPAWTQRAALTGILGAGEFTDLADGMLPLLKLGSYLNAGKGAAYGMGGYRIKEA